MKANMTCDRWAGFNPAPTLLAVSALLAAGLCSTPALRAQDTGQPARAIRLSYVDGKVQLSQDNQPVTDQAVINTPLFQGMTLTTADDGRAEIQFEDGSVARISPDSSLTLKVLRGQGTSADAEMDLNNGLAYFELQGNGQAGQIRVRFGDSVVTGSGFTVLRITDDTPPGAVAVFSGNAHLERASGLELDIHGGESVALNAGDPNDYNLAESIEPNSWDTWNSDRDQALTAEEAAQTSAPANVSSGQADNPAWSDLDANGTWYNVPDQGYVWSPYDAANAGFDPYGNGNWVFTPGFGYTWASGYSWGYMPFQCGAWNFYNGFGWGWAPGFGGCNPWWGVGYYGGPNIGLAPGWYRPLRRPVGPRGLRPGRPAPMIPVHRQSPVMNVGLPSRDRDMPVAINGHSVMGLRPMPSQSAYERTAFGGQRGNSSSMPASPVARPGYVVDRPGYIRPTGATGYTPGQRTYAPPTRGPNQPARQYSPSPSSPRPSGGGGGGEFHGGSGGGGASAGHSGGGGGGRR